MRRGRRKLNSPLRYNWGVKKLSTSLRTLEVLEVDRLQTGEGDMTSRITAKAKKRIGGKRTRREKSNLEVKEDQKIRKIKKRVGGKRSSWNNGDRSGTKMKSKRIGFILREESEEAREGLRVKQGCQLRQCTDKWSLVNWPTDSSLEKRGLCCDVDWKPLAYLFHGSPFFSLRSLFAIMAAQ